MDGDIGTITNGLEESLHLAKLPSPTKSRTEQDGSCRQDGEMRYGKFAVVGTHSCEQSGSASSIPISGCRMGFLDPGKTASLSLCMRRGWSHISDGCSQGATWKRLRGRNVEWPARQRSIASGVRHADEPVRMRDSHVVLRKWSEWSNPERNGLSEHPVLTGPVPENHHALHPLRVGLLFSVLIPIRFNAGARAETDVSCCPCLTTSPHLSAVISCLLSHHHRSSSSSLYFLLSRIWRRIGIQH